jgi:hypothetical protein
MSFFLATWVNAGFKEKRWMAIDSALTSFQQAGIKTDACLGNHELIWSKNAGERCFQNRFPGHVNTGFTVIEDSVASVFLNSNFKKMTREQIKKQDDWYHMQLQTLDTMASVRAVIVCCHHSPYSDSKMAGSSKEVQEKFVGAFLHSSKAKTFS